MKRLIACLLLLATAACSWGGDPVAHDTTPPSMDAAPSTSVHCSIHDIGGGAGSTDCH